MGLLHHANYLVYFEQARTDLLRSLGSNYKDLEDQGFYLVITKIDVQYKRPAHYDDVLTIRTTVTRTSLVRLEHQYEVLRGENSELIATGSSTLACVNTEGKIQPMPNWLAQAK